MKLFINNKRVKLIARNESIRNNEYDVFISPSQPLDLNKMDGHVLVSKPTDEELDSFLKLLELKQLEKVKTISFIVDEPLITEKYIKSRFKVIKAAGGIVLKNDKILLIHRLGVWDLPKGKLENGEPASECAVREVEEECGVKAEIETKICSTWHSYTDKEKRILKKTTWYLMRCLSDKGMKPQVEEQIDEIKWADFKQARMLIGDSYESIKYVLKKYKEIEKFV